MSVRRRIAATLTAIAGAIGCAGTADAESAGRVEFDLPSPAWQLLLAHEHPLRYQSGKEITLFTKTYALPGSGTVPKALLQVTGTSGSAAGRTQWVTERCPEPRAKYFTADFDSNKLTRQRECIVVNPAFVAANFFSASDPVLDALKTAGLELPATAYSLRATVGNDGGAFVRVHLIAARSFVGLPNAVPAAGDTHGVAPELVAWGEALHGATKAATGLRGRLDLPPIEFKD